MKIKILLLSISMTVLFGCSLSDEKSPFAGIPEQELFNIIQNKFADNKYEDVVNAFETFDTEYPTSDFASAALIEYIYALFILEKYDLALAESDRFIRMYSSHEHVDYILYLRGIINMDKGRVFLDKLFASNISMVDLEDFQEAYNSLALLIDNYPSSMYAKDALNRMVYIRNLLIQKEFEIAKFYYTRGLYVGAINRISNMLIFMPKNKQSLAALQMLKQSNHKLGLESAVRDTQEIIDANF